MYLLDPDRGARRRNTLRDKLFRAYRESEEGIQKTAEYVRNRARGIAAETRAAMSSEEISDETLVARIRSAIGRACSHPHALRITARDGFAIVSGPILADEAGRVISTINRVRGVRDVENHLEPHATPADVPELQGPGRHLRSGFRRQNWSPWNRLWVGLGGAALAGSGFARGGLLGIGTILGGGWLLLRSLTNLPARRIFGISAGRRAENPHLKHTIETGRPPRDASTPLEQEAT